MNIIFPTIFSALAPIENYRNQQTLTIFLIRTGFIRLGSLIFLFISISINIFNVTGHCSSQSNTILTNSIYSNGSTTDLSKANSTIKVLKFLLAFALFNIFFI